MQCEQATIYGHLIGEFAYAITVTLNKSIGKMQNCADDLGKQTADKRLATKKCQFLWCTLHLLKPNGTPMQLCSTISL